MTSRRCRSGAARRSAQFARMSVGMAMSTRWPQSIQKLRMSGADRIAAFGVLTAAGPRVMKSGISVERISAMAMPTTSRTGPGADGSG